MCSDTKVKDVINQLLEALEKATLLAPGQNRKRYTLSLDNLHANEFSSKMTLAQCGLVTGSSCHLLVRSESGDIFLDV